LTTFTDGVIKSTERIKCMGHGDTKISSLFGICEGRKYFGGFDVGWWIMLK